MYKNRKLEGLSHRERAQYIWDYYKLWILAFCAVVFVFGYMISNYVHNNRENHIYIAFVNTYADFGENTDFYKGYAEKSKTDTTEENIVFDTENYFDLDKGNVTGNYYYEKLVVLLDGSTADAVVMDRDNMEIMGTRGRLMNLKNKKTEHLLEQYSNRIVTVSCTDENGKKLQIPIGIDISDSKVVRQEHAYEGDCVLGISANAQHIDAIGEFLTYILE